MINSVLAPSLEECYVPKSATKFLGKHMARGYKKERSLQLQAYPKTDGPPCCSSFRIWHKVDHSEFLRV